MNKIIITYGFSSFGPERMLPTNYEAKEGPNVRTNNSKP